MPFSCVGKNGKIILTDVEFKREIDHYVMPADRERIEKLGAGESYVDQIGDRWTRLPGKTGRPGRPRKSESIGLRE